MAWADLVICRAGALTVSELAAAGLPALLVPLPHAIDDHQTRNAHYLADEGAAFLLPQATTGAADLAARLTEVLMHRERLKTMAAPRLVAWPKPDATKQGGRYLPGGGPWLRAIKPSRNRKCAVSAASTSSASAVWACVGLPRCCSTSVIRYPVRT